MAVKTKESVVTIPKGAGFFRRLGAWFYDVLMLVAVEMVAVSIALLSVNIGFWLGYFAPVYPSPSAVLLVHPVISPLFTCYIFGVLALFYGYFWCKAGQTLGMRAWKLKVINEDGGLLTPTQAVIRLATACLGLGNLLVLIDSKNRAFQDHFARCQVILVDK